MGQLPSLKGCVIIEAYSFEDKLILRDAVDLYEWHESALAHPLIDEQAQRLQHTVHRIKGWQFDYHGALYRWWTSVYSINGDLQEGCNYDADGQTNRWTYADGVIETATSSSSREVQQSVEDEGQLAFDF